jgi:hypothetical protein
VAFSIFCCELLGEGLLIGEHLEFSEGAVFFIVPLPGAAAL